MGLLPLALHDADLALRRTGKDSAELAWNLLNEVRDDEASAAPVAALKAEAGIGSDGLERLLLWKASQQALPRVSSLPINNMVRDALDQDLRQLHSMNVRLEAGGYHFNRAAKMATLRRFPAGPMEWELSGIPRSWIFKAAFPANLRLLAFVATRLGGFAPCLFIHVAPTPRNRGLSVPKQVLRSYYRMARSLQMQPAARALVAHAWFHDPAAVRDHPHLEVLSRPFVEHGGLVVLLDDAPPSSGVLERNAQRKTDYIAGKVHYRYGLAIWPREAAFRWADENQDLES